MTLEGRHQSGGRTGSRRAAHRAQTSAGEDRRPVHGHDFHEMAAGRGRSLDHYALQLRHLHDDKFAGSWRTRERLGSTPDRKESTT